MTPIPDEAPFLSIVTIVYNDCAGFEATSESLAREAPENTEWIVVDGASGDGTVAAIEAVSARIARWISEKDRGIADAFNTGIGLARGSYVLFLNAGDRLAPGAATQLARMADDFRGAPVIVGRIEMAGRRHGRSVPFWRQYMRNHLPHQAMLIRRDLFDELGRYDDLLRLGMDFEWSLRLRPHWSQIAFTPYLLSIMEPGGVSISNPEKTFAAYHNARVRHFGKPWLSVMVSWYYRLKRQLLQPVRPLINVIRSRAARARRAEN